MKISVNSVDFLIFFENFFIFWKFEFFENFREKIENLNEKLFEFLRTFWSKKCKFDTFLIYFAQKCRFGIFKHLSAW
jgi:hypothetical protein